ncbi:MAG TPA: hypothetical protein VN937_10920 [Blastocatellia bacterium]|nr:hypothetical protein [Blastocatellia bacterium]
MTATDVLSEIHKLSLDEAREVAERLEKYLREQETTMLATEDTEAREDEFERQLLAKGVINHIPSRDETDEEFDKFDPIDVAGEPLSETIIRERR